MAGYEQIPGDEEWLAAVSHPKKRAWLAAYAVNGTATAACRAANVSYAMCKEWRKQGGRWYDPDFCDLLEIAEEKATDLLEHAARRRAVEGIERLVLYRGAPVMVKNDRGQDVPLTEKQYSDGLLSHMLNAKKPESYGRTRHEHTGADGGPMQIQVVVEVARENIRDRINRLREGVEIVDSTVDPSSNGRPTLPAGDSENGAGAP